MKQLISDEKLASISYQNVIEGLAQGKVYQDLLEISDDTIQAMFESANRYMEAGQFDESADCFLFLATLNPLVANLWIKAGNAEQALSRYEEALEAYSMAMFCDADDPFPHYYSAEIYIELRSYHEANECINVCLHLIQEHEIFLPLKEPVIHLKERIRRHV